MARKYNGVWPPPIACARFRGGEYIRMSFGQVAGKPWRVDAAREWLCAIIGDERGRRGVFQAGLEALQKRIEAARELAARPGTVEEGKSARDAVERMERTLARQRSDAMGEVFNALDVYSKRYPPATDLADFWFEMDGRRVDPSEYEPVKRLAAPRKAKALAAPKPQRVLPAPEPVADPAAKWRELGALFLTPGHGAPRRKAA